MNKPTKLYVVIQQHIVGGLAAWESCYHCDGRTFASRRKAIAHGWRVLDHDDFNIWTSRLR